MWRPKDWRKGIKPSSENTYTTNDLNHMYESGADAMLTHLKSQKHADWLATKEGQNSKGEWYYIPDEE